MENSIYLALSRQMTLRTNMDVIANNVANATTPGYRGQNLLFQSYLADQDGDLVDPAAEDDLAFVYNRGQYQTEDQGSFRFTGNPLDIALSGPGFFGVQGANGETFYSRSGRLQLDANGTIVTSNGDPVTNSGGAPITVPEGSTEIKIDATGFISNQDGQVGQIGIFEFDNVQELQPRGNTLYFAPNGGQPATDTKVEQGMLESSNITPVIEVTRMIDTLRNYQSMQRVISNENDRLRSMIQRLTGQS